MDSAKQVAQKREVPILMVFAGSDWCRPCMQFKQQVLTNEAFLAYADTALVILYLDFPAKKKNQLDSGQLKHNEALAERYNKSGAFPAIIMLNAQEEILAKLVYRQQTAEEFIQELQICK
jgi:thioredoxin-related protein